MQSNILILLFAILAALTAVAAATSSDKHAENLRKAKKAYRKIQKLHDAAVIPYLRRLDPFVFEELILIAFRKKGYRTFRNGRYSGDGGVDGKVRKRFRTYLIQDKRYSGYIDPAHVLAFEHVCRKRHVRGFFIHTGRTGTRSREVLDDCPRVSVISGKALVDLLRGR